MPKADGNPNRKWQGGDVPGMTEAGNNDSVFTTGITVAKASYDPGYDLATTLDGVDADDLKVGFCTNSRDIGERDYTGRTK